MSYDTTYNLSWQGHSPTQEEMAQALARDVDGSDPSHPEHQNLIHEWQEMTETDRTLSKWYTHEQDLARLSRLWPQTVFALTIESEQGEHHLDYYLNGMVHTVTGSVTYPLFDPSQLRHPK